MMWSEGPVDIARAAVVIAIATLIMVGLAVFDGILRAVIR